MRKSMIWAASGVVVLALAGGGAAADAATAHEGSSTTFYGCVQSSGLLSRVIADVEKHPVKCKSGSPISWDQQGPQGPQGSSGVTGATGPRGPAGPSTAGPAGLDVIPFHATVAGQGESVTCPASNPYAIGGGGDAVWSSNGGGGSIALTASEPIINGGSGYPFGWGVEAAPPTMPGERVTAYVICAK